jgi:hypothetical protein
LLKCKIVLRFSPLPISRAFFTPIQQQDPFTRQAIVHERTAFVQQAKYFT